MVPWIISSRCILSMVKSIRAILGQYLKLPDKHLEVESTVVVWTTETWNNRIILSLVLWTILKTPTTPTATGIFALIVDKAPFII